MSTYSGKRENASRPSDQGRFGEPTKIMRIPEGQTANDRNFLDALQRKRQAAKNELVNSEMNMEAFFSSIINEQPTHIPLFTNKVARSGG